MEILRLRSGAVAAAAAAALALLGVASPGASARPAPSDDCHVTYVAQAWPGGFSARVHLDSPSRGMLAWRYTGGDVLTQAWGADVTQAGDLVAAGGTDPSRTIDLVGRAGAVASAPTGFALDGRACSATVVRPGATAAAATQVDPAAVVAEAKATKKCRTLKNGKKTCKTVTKTKKTSTKTKTPTTTTTRPTTTTTTTTSTPPQNVASTSTFEDGTVGGWTARGPETLAVTTQSAHAGSRSLQVSGRTSAWNGPTLDLTSVMLPGRTYQLSAYARLASGETATTLNLTAERAVDGTTSYDHVSGDVAATDQGWVRLTGSYTVPSGVTTLRIYVESPSATAGFLLDDVVVSTDSTPPTTTTTTTGPTTTTTSPTPTTSTTTQGNWPPSSTFTNPVLWEDLADLDIVRVGDVYYYTASNMHYSPGAPILRSYDLVNWEYAGHALPTLDFGSKYDLSGGRAYIKGSWASFFNYRPQNKTYYWGGCIEFGKSYIYSAPAVEGPWTRLSTFNKCYYDSGMMVDDDGTMYLAYGSTTINVAQLSSDGKSEVRSQSVFTSPSDPGYIEGSRMFKRNGAYYIFVTKPANGQYILKSTNGPFGPYSMQKVLLNLRGPISGGGVPHQGALFSTAAGQWYYMAFIDAYPGGRVPTLAPVTWTSDGWPQLQTVNSAWGTTYPFPSVPRPPRIVDSTLGTDKFTSSTLGPQWEWNHNPDNSRWSAGSGLKLQTATVTNDLYSARNTLTHRIRGPVSTATIELDYSDLRDGDRSGLVLLRHQSAWIGVTKDGSTTKLVMTNGLTMDSNWNTTSTGSAAASADLFGGKVWLRITADIAPGGSKQATFWYSTDGSTFQRLGPSFTMNSDWQFFMGYRFGMFSYATKALGGSATVKSFTVTAP